MAKNIMLQGTMSNVGKSLLTAALCRIFRQDGYSAAPFKSQNMALNSYITADGSEIGRAQAMQAEAAGLEPSVLMNPILLKPTTDVGSQVIVNGRVRGNMRATEYFRHKKELIPDILAAYGELSAQHDIIVIEGAGSAAELNLKADDIVNMGLAKLVDSPVLLVGDIDRGGIFAQLLGTLMLIEPDEHERIKGLIVNKFRGDKAIFQSGVDILEQRGGVPVAGVVPYIKCDIEDEDSLSDKLGSRAADGIIDITVIRLPHISNYTDFDVFLQYYGVSVRYVTKYTELGEPDMIVIPGTKSTIADMRWLHESGFETAIKKAAGRIPVFGICGGYQMLGKSISDPLNSEGGGEIGGIGLLDTATVFAGEKHQTQTSGHFAQIGGMLSALSGLHFTGYEIHM
ncbi:MAG: cobyric acid synthase, partial [Ruminiclostridium sp.]|nr:cobyric acid synthase [Ruminiclostridium sp.]